MRSMIKHLSEYVAARRALGTRLEEPAQTLRQFVKFLARRKTPFITVAVALEWSQQSRGVQRATWGRKLSMVRQFARWMNALDPRHQVPPRRLLNVRHRRGKPHIYSDDEITRLMAEAAQLKSADRMRALTLETLIGLLAATGLRPCEMMTSTCGGRFWPFENQSSASLGWSRSIHPPRQHSSATLDIVTRAFVTGVARTSSFRIAVTRWIWPRSAGGSARSHVTVG